MNVYFGLQHHCFGMVGKQWFKNVRMTGISSFTIADFFIKMAAFHAKSKFWPRSFDISLRKINSFIIEQIIIIEFCPLNIIVLTSRI